MPTTPGTREIVNTPHGGSWVFCFIWACVFAAETKAQGHRIFTIGNVLDLTTICATLYLASSYRRIAPEPHDYLIIISSGE